MTDVLTGPQTSPASGAIAGAAQGVVCPVCGSPARRSIPAQIAPFLRARCRIPAAVGARSNFCDACEHVFITPFLTEDELDRLYLGYRNAEYNLQRLRFEPDYQHHIDQFSSPKSDYHRVRREFYDEFHVERVDQRGVVVDFSEGVGYFARYAYPNADVVVLPRVGVPPGVDLTKLLSSAKVLVSTHALQAAPRPRERLAQLVGPLQPGTTVWIEVPIDYRGSLRANFDLLEARFARGVREFGPLQTLHESLAHFSVRSLRALLAAVDLAPTEFVRSNIGVLGVLAHRI